MKDVAPRTGWRDAGGGRNMKTIATHARDGGCGDLVRVITFAGGCDTPPHFFARLDKKSRPDIIGPALSAEPKPQSPGIRSRLAPPKTPTVTVEALSSPRCPPAAGKLPLGPEISFCPTTRVPGPGWIEIFCRFSPTVDCLSQTVTGSATGSMPIPRHLWPYRNNEDRRWRK